MPRCPRTPSPAEGKWPPGAPTPSLALALAVIILVSLAAPTLADPPASTGSGSFSIARQSIDGGAQRASGGEFTLTGVVGQTDPGVATGGQFNLRGGFHRATGSLDGIFSDGFEP